MKKVITIIIGILLIGYLFHLNYRSNLKTEEMQTFIDECVMRNGKLETVGNWYSREFIVCYPNK